MFFYWWFLGFSRDLARQTIRPWTNCLWVFSKIPISPDKTARTNCLEKKFGLQTICHGTFCLYRQFVRQTKRRDFDRQNGADKLSGPLQTKRRGQIVCTDNFLVQTICRAKFVCITDKFLPDNLSVSPYNLHYIWAHGK